jgi:hypothetical protein
MNPAFPVCIHLNEDCNAVRSDNVYYTGINLPCSGVITGENLTSILIKMDAAICSTQGHTVKVVDNYSALPDPYTAMEQVYFVSYPQGNPWIPESEGGNFHNSGVYYSDGSSWLSADVPHQATQAEVDAGVVDDQFVTPATLANSVLIIGKQNKLTLTTIGTDGPSTLINDTLNIPIYSGATDLDYIPLPDRGIVTSSTGADATITLVTSTLAGLLSPQDYLAFKAKQDAITLTTNGTGGIATFVNNILNIPVYADSAASGQTEWFPWNYNNNINAGDPGGGTFRFNNLDYSLVTHMYIDSITDNGVNMDTIFATMKGNWNIYIQDANEAELWVMFSAIADNWVNMNGWWDFPVTYVEKSANPLHSNQKCAFLFLNKNGGTNTFTSDIPVVLSGGKTVGKYTNGQTIPAIGKTAEQVFHDIALEYIPPTFGSFSVTGQPTTVEVGTQMIGSKTFNWSITPNSGVVNTVDIYDNTASTVLVANTPNDGSQPVFVTTTTLTSAGATQSWKLVAHDTGTTPGDISSGNFVVTALYNRYCGPVNAYPTDNNDGAGNRTYASALPTIAFKTNGVNTFTLATGVAYRRFIVLLPYNSTITKVTDTTNSNVDLTANYVLVSNNFMINDASGTAARYNMYQYTNSIPYTVSANHTITTT